MITELSQTVDLMCSSNYKDRFAAEYFQLKIRYNKLVTMVEKWDRGELEFTPTCQRVIYDRQLSHMSDLLKVLDERAIIENVDLESY